MKIIYVHHAHRKMGNPPSQDDDITELGKQDAKLVGELLVLAREKGTNIKAIYTSPFKRCIKTANIINEKVQVEIISEERFNEAGSVKDETWRDVQTRTRAALYDIDCRFDDKDTVVCVTSGVNVVAFMSLVFNLKPREDAPFIGVSSCSPLIFNITKENFKEFKAK